MNKSISVLGIITARSGSKGIKEKNIINLCDKPLINYTIEAAQASKFLTRLVVSTDSKKIARIANNAGVEVPFLRPSNLATDDARTIDVINHLLKWIKQNENIEYDYAMILQPTSPLRTSTDIDNSIRLAQETGADSVMSMVKLVDMALEKLKRIKDNKIISAIKEEGHISAFRNEKEPIYKRNTAIYLTKTKTLMRGNLFGEISRPYIMPAERSIDINYPIDLDMAEFFLKKENYGKD